MAPARAAAYLGGTTLLLAWLASAAGVSRQPRSSGAELPSASGGQLDALTADVQSQAARLRLRLAAAPAPQAPLRDPFSFSPRSATSERPSAAPELLSRRHDPAAFAAEPVLELVGVAEQKTDTGSTRTAIVAAPGDALFLVTEGQELAGRYRVNAIGAEAVELRDLETGLTRRLGLR
jgi:hypothetical protein